MFYIFFLLLEIFFLASFIFISNSYYAELALNKLIGCILLAQNYAIVNESCCAIYLTHDNLSIIANQEEVYRFDFSQFNLENFALNTQVFSKLEDKCLIKFDEYGYTFNNGEICYKEKCLKLNQTFNFSLS